MPNVILTILKQMQHLEKHWKFYYAPKTVFICYIDHSYKTKITNNFGALKGTRWKVRDYHVEYHNNFRKKGYPAEYNHVEQIIITGSHYFSFFYFCYTFLKWNHFLMKMFTSWVFVICASNQLLAIHVYMKIQFHPTIKM